MGLDLNGTSAHRPSCDDDDERTVEGCRGVRNDISGAPVDSTSRRDSGPPESTAAVDMLWSVGHFLWTISEHLWRTARSSRIRRNSWRIPLREV